MITITFSLSGETAELDNLDDMGFYGVYFGNPSENIIIASGDMYTVIHNPTKLSLTVMGREAKEYCTFSWRNAFTTLQGTSITC